MFDRIAREPIASHQEVAVTRRLPIPNEILLVVLLPYHFGFLPMPLSSVFKDDETETGKTREAEIR